MLDPNCIYRKSIFAKYTRLACLLSFASLFYLTWRDMTLGTQCLGQGPSGVLKVLQIVEHRTGVGVIVGGHCGGHLASGDPFWGH